MALTQTEVLGFNTKVIAAMNEHKAACLAGKLDVSDWPADQDQLATTASKEDAKQEKMKQDLKDQTTVTDAAYKTLFDTTSTRLDAMAAAVGKTTELGKALLALRSQIRQGAQAPKAPAAQKP